MTAGMDDSNQPSCEEAPGNFSLCRTLGLFTGDMRLCRKWVSRQNVMIQLLDWILRGMAQVMFVNNPLSGLLITAGLFLQNPWWALNSLLGTLVSTVSAIFLGQSSPVVSSALSTVASKWDLPIFTLPFNILVCLHVAATGANHPYFPQVDIQPHNHQHPRNDSTESLNIFQLFLSVPVGVGQVYGCDSPWTGGVILLGLLLSSPTICLHAMVGSAAGVLTGLALAAPLWDIYSGLWGYNSALSCIAVGGVFYVITWQTHLLAVICALFSAYMTSATSRLMSVLALPACTWPFCLSTLIFLLVSSEIPAICRLPLSVVSYPEESLRNRRRLKASEGVRRSQQGSSQEEEEEKALPKENRGTDNQSVEERGSV
ncbi:urea transporter 2-like isoform X3 [Hippoglossus hippoglossus]|uniref:urea transporter 2-like isoform X3 n=1 Tax=Hippoglossus hippoglossus TaxID=8267 RepID=UPI00148D468E|nr:urea transporter 2-like isoform X3 [Hippoglossus hippoglossus]